MHTEKLKMQKLLLIYCSASKSTTLFCCFCNVLCCCRSSVQICIGTFLCLCRPAKVIGIPQGEGPICMDPFPCYRSHVSLQFAKGFVRAWKVTDLARYDHFWEYQL